MMTSNINQFLKSVNKDIKAIQDKQQKKAKEIILYAHDEIVNLSPVDTSLFKHSNFITFNSVPSDLVDSPKTRDAREAQANANKNKQEIERADLSLTPLKNNDKISIYNNLVYAQRIENGGADWLDENGKSVGRGWSSQAPTGVYGVVKEKVRKKL